MSQASSTKKPYWLRLQRTQALELIEKLLRGVQVVEFSVDDDLNIELRPLGVDEPRQDTDVSVVGRQGLILQPDTGEVRVEGHRAETLTSMEYRLLSHRYAHQNMLVSSEEVCQVLWPDESYTYADLAGALHKLVSRLRAKIEPEPAKPRYLTTVRGRGYRLRTE
jgi:DNA-binding response OmpR family regulator